jgi:hypothetical protein
MLDYELIAEDTVCTINQEQLFVSFSPFGRAYQAHGLRYKVFAVAYLPLQPLCLAHEAIRLVNVGLGQL